MGRRHVSKPFEILKNADISSDVTGEWSEVSQYDAITYLADWLGDADGELVVEISNDKKVVHPLNFGEVVSIDDTQNPKQHQILINSVATKFMRLRYVSSSGSGTMDASIIMTTRGA